MACTDTVLVGAIRVVQGTGQAAGDVAHCMLRPAPGALDALLVALLSCVVTKGCRTAGLAVDGVWIDH